jgi:hypothetical protein
MLFVQVSEVIYVVRPGILVLFALFVFNYVYMCLCCSVFTSSTACIEI